MQHEIIFRGKRTDNGEWVYGDLEHLSYGIIIIQVYMVDPETVSQYTGLNDSAGKKVFEGDIVRVSYSKAGTVIGVVSWAESECAFMADVKHGLTHIFMNLGKHPKAVKVLGNVHDTPELLGWG
jgi:uncharacterized phage protein (TIGR01671 family)